MARIILKDIEKRFGRVVAVDGVNLEIEEGSFTVLLGPSGCGKTTTLNMIAGLEEPTNGLILFDDDEVQDIPVHRRNVAMVFQSYALYPNRSVRDNIGFGLRLRKLPRGEIRDRVEDVAGRLGIQELLERRPRQLSGGQQQRVALARAIVRRPQVFLLDEPLSNLDAKLRNDMRVELKTLQQELGATFVYVTHDQSEAMSLADRIVVMHEGQIQQVARPLELYQNPENLFVATFIGNPQMNVIEGDLEGGVFAASGWSCQIERGAAAGPVRLGVRAEDVELSGDPKGLGTLRIIEYLGAESLLVIGMPFGDLVARGPAVPTIALGDRFEVAVRPERVHLFDPASGLRRGSSLGPDAARGTGEIASPGVADRQGAA